MAGTYRTHGETMACKIIVRISEENTQKIKIQFRAGFPKLFCMQIHFGFKKNHRSSNPCTLIQYPDDRYPKLKIYISGLILDRYQ